MCQLLDVNVKYARARRHALKYKYMQQSQRRSRNIDLRVGARIALRTGTSVVRTLPPRNINISNHSLTPSHPYQGTP